MPVRRFARPALLVAVSALIAFLLAFMMAPVAENPGITREGTVTFSGLYGPAVLDVEIADTPEEHSTGLMHREVLGDGEGMLFIFADDYPRSFWMKNTLIPLDMIFINSTMHIVGIREDVQPCRTLSCPSYSSGRPAMYVVEANSGFSGKSGIEPGQRVSFSLPE